MIPRQTEKLKAAHRRAVDGFDEVWSVQEEGRKQAINDRRFASIPGAQWEGNLGEQFENRPKFEVNKIQSAITRIFNEYRNNRIGITFIPKDGAKDETLPETCASLYRADEQDSNAEEAYDNAFDESVSGGMGAWRLRACYEDEYDEDDDRQRVKVEPIFDADQTVYFDLQAKRQDKGNATKCWVLTAMTHSAYKEKYGQDPTGWQKDEESKLFDWCQADAVYIAEYYEVVEAKATVYIFKSQLGEEEKLSSADFAGDEDSEEDLAEAMEELVARGFTMTKEKSIKTREVRKYILDGRQVLEDCGRIAGKHIPIVPVFGRRFYIDGIERFMGHVRHAKDAQRIKNMQLSKLGEIAAQSSIEKPILTPEQVLGHEQYWEDDPIKNFAFMLLNPVTGMDGSKTPMGPIGYTKPPQVPPALAALVQISEQDLAEILGYNQQQEKMVSNISGKAVELIQDRVDQQAFIYLSNFGKAMRRSAEIWLDMARELYTEKKRKMKAVDKYGEVAQVELMKPELDKDTGRMQYGNDLSRAKYDVTFDVGPSSASKKQAIVRGLTGMMAITQDPETQSILASAAMMNMEGEGLEDIRAHFRRKMVMAGVVKPTEEEQQQMEAASQNKQPDPQSEAFLAMAEKDRATAQKVRADTLSTLATADKSKAQTLEILSGIDAQEQARALEVQTATAQPTMGANGMTQ